MKVLRTGYAYLFFFLYNSINTRDNILVQWKAVFLILGLEIVTLLSLLVYFTNITKLGLPEDFNRLNLLLIIIPLVGVKLWFFEWKDRWKQYIEEFSVWPLEKKRKWNWAMRFLIGLVFANIIIAFYWMSQIDWTLYR